jgi:hypothetical protein
MQPKDINVYSALIFADRPDLHMTLRYWKQVSPCGLANRIRSLDNHLARLRQEHTLERIPILFTRTAQFGWSNKVRVIFPDESHRWPLWLRELVPPKALPNMHVTCTDPTGIVLEATSVAIMCKSNVICQWDLASVRLPNGLEV